MEDKNYLISIFVTNYNKSKYLQQTLQSIKNQRYKNFEIIIYDDCSEDNSVQIINNFKLKNKKKIFNKKKISNIAELNQLNGLKQCLKVSRGKIICLLDGDDKFKKNKLYLVNKFFRKNIKSMFLVNNISNKNKNFNKKLIRITKDWPVIYPTSCISMRREFFKNFIKEKLDYDFPLLAVDLRLIFFAKFFFKDNNFLEEKLTFYRFDKKNNENNYKKFNKRWWLRRYQAFEFLKLIKKRKRLKFNYSIDYFFTFIINYFLIK